MASSQTPVEALLGNEHGRLAAQLPAIRDCGPVPEMSVGRSLPPDPPSGPPSWPPPISLCRLGNRQFSVVILTSAQSRSATTVAFEKVRASMSFPAARRSYLSGQLSGYGGSTVGG